MKAPPLAASAAITLAATACGGATPSKELVNARQAYNVAAQSPAAVYSPNGVQSARQALDQAERAYAGHPGSDDERTHAYVAQRRSELALTQAREAYERSQKERAEKEYALLLGEKNRRTQAELQASQGQVEAQKRALEEVGDVREDLRGTVVTISGAVLFETGKAELLPAAREALARAGKAMASGGRPIRIEGYTDSRGSDGSNQTLSTQRAEAVRDFLVKQGVKAERIEAVGMGEASPVASNATDEGRANNRRVEIVLGKMTPASGER